MNASRRRWLFGLESGALVVVALVVCVLVIDLAAGTYWRFDASADRRNTLAPEIADRIQRLPAPVEVDVFFRPLRPPFERPAAEARGRLLELLYKAQNSRRDRMTVTVHDLTDLAGVRARQQQLGVEGTQLIVFSCSGRRATFGLFDEIADLDWGNPTREGLLYLQEEGLADALDPRTWDPDPRAGRPPFLARFRGEEVLATALAKVSAGEPPVVRFLVGHKEPDLDGATQFDLSRLRKALEADGFRVETWDPANDVGVPAGTDVLAVVGPEQPIEEEVRSAIHDWVDAGGRLFVAPSLAEALEGLQGGAAKVAFRYGMVLEPGVVCQSFRDRLNRVVEGRPECARLVLGENELSASHAVTEPLRMRGARIHASLVPPFRVGQHPGGSQPIAIVSSPADAWVDLPDAAGRPNFRRDPGEQTGRRPLVLVADFGVRRGDEAAEVRRSVVIGVSSSLLLANDAFDANRDFLMNAFNHLAERDFRIGVTPSERHASHLDLRADGALSKLSLALNFGLPGLFVLVGLVFAWRRRS